MQKYSAPLCQYLVEPPLAEITAASLLGYVSTSFAHLETGIFAHSSLQNSSSSARLVGERLWTAVFRSCHRFSIGFRSGLWLGHSNTGICFILNHSIVALALCLGSLSCWKVNLCPSSLLQILAGFLPRLSCFWLHPSSHQLWPASLSLLKKSSPTTWCCHHHVWQWGWCVESDVQC